MIKKVFVMLSVIGLLYSCSTSNDVVSNGFFQKRKYQKGWHVNKTQKIKRNNKSSKIEDVAFRECNLVYNDVVKKEKSVVDVKADKLEARTTNKVDDFSFKGNNVVIEKTNDNKVASSSENTEELVLVTNEELNVTQKEVNPATAKKVSGDTSSNGHSMLMLYLLAIFIPFVAVGLVTDWETDTVLISLLLSLLCYIPGVIHAFITIGKYK